MDQQQGTKRKAEGGSEGQRSKSKKQWRVPRGDVKNAPRAIMPGDSGIFATCNKGREARCVGELRDLFSEYASQLYGDAADDDDDNDNDGGATSIENDIKAELAGIQKPVTAQLFVPVKLDVQCVVFFKTIAPVEPVSFIHKICEDAMAEPMRKRTRTAKRLAPMTLMGKATMEGLESVARDVLAPHFHQAPVTPKKFAVRPNMRNHNTMKRDAIIKMVAGLVGQPHKVDLKNYDLLITIEIYQNICGVSVVDHRFEELKRYNISEIFDPTPKEETRVEKRDDGEDGGKVIETAKDENAVVTAETGKEAATDAKPTDENNEKGISSAVKGEASSEANEAKTTGQDDEGGVSAVQEDDAQANAPDDSAGAP